MSFEIVPKDEVPARSKRTGKVSPMSEALLAGETIFLPGGAHNTVGRFRSKRSAVSRAGLRVRGWAGERHGVKGVFVEAVKA